MNGISATKKRGLLPPDHQGICSCTSNGIDLEQVSGTWSVLTMSFSPLVSAQSEKRFLITFSSPVSLDHHLQRSRPRMAVQTPTQV